MGSSQMRLPRLGAWIAAFLCLAIVLTGALAMDANASKNEHDVIVEVDKKPVKSVADLKESVEKHGKGKPMLFRVHRQDASLFLTVTV